MDSSKLREMLFNEYRLDITQPVLIGLSGGPDSLCLLHLAINAGCRVIAAHLDHALRPSSLLESEQLQIMCGNLGLEFIHYRMDVGGYATENKLSIEEAARLIRYRFLFESAENTNSQAVLVGHHADDQVETVLMHLLRGSGLSGLRGMKRFFLPNPWSNTIPLIRPLLGIRRAEIEEYCQNNGLEPIRDESNADTLLHRNRIRHELIPELETYNQNFSQNLLKTAALLQSEDDFIENEVRVARQMVTSTASSKYVVFKRKEFLKLNLPIQRRLIRNWIQEILSSLQDIDFDVVERARNFILSGNSSNTLQLMGGMEMFVQYHDEVVIGSGEYEGLWPRLPQSAKIPVMTPMKLRIDDNHVFTCARSDQSAPGSSSWSARFDTTQIIGNLFLRTRKAGDRFKPFGLDGKTQKLGDFWTNEGLPVQARSHWPLLCDDREIIWVPGFRIADPYKITPDTKGVIEVQIYPSKPGQE